MGNLPNMNWQMKSFPFNVLFVFIFCALQINVTGQTTQERVAMIRKMYAEVQTFLKNSASAKCSNGKSILYFGEGPEELQNVEFRVDQNTSICNLPKGYQYLKGRFKGFDWLNNYEIFLLNGKVFFAYIERAVVESCSMETRLYYNESGYIIKYLEKTTSCEEDDGSREIKNKDKIKTAEIDIADAISKIQDIIKYKSIKQN